MPELPEVEIVRCGIAPAIEGGIIDDVIVRERRLRLSPSLHFRRQIRGRKILQTRRRGKWLIIDLERGAILAHLGMTGVLYFAPRAPAAQHEHIGLKIGDGFLIYRDPRRFGGMMWLAETADNHPCLQRLGPEPLSAAFDGEILYHALRGRQTPIKTALLDGGIVAGVGNIYASESLHGAGIRPQTAAAKIGKIRAAKLADAIKITLRKAIRAGGSTIRDFVNPEQTPGYFQAQWRVYARENLPCRCGGTIRRIIQNGRASYYCPRCQR